MPGHTSARAGDTDFLIGTGFACSVLLSCGCTGPWCFWPYMWPLATATWSRCGENSRKEPHQTLLRAGAAVNRPDLSLDKAWMNPSLYPILLRAGATFLRAPAHPDPYLAKILKAGGFRGNGFQNYERARRHAINAIFIPKFAHVLPPELVRRVVEFYWLHAPYY